VSAESVLFVGAGRQQRRAIVRARELGLRVVAVDRNPDAPGLAEADVAEVVDFLDLEAVIRVARDARVDGVLTIASDRAVPVVAAVAEALELPGIGTETAHVMTHKVAMRRRLAEHGMRQPRFAAARTLGGARAALRRVGLPAVLKPADSAGQRGVFLLESVGDLERHLHAALAESPTGDVIVERYHEGLEVNALVVMCDGEPALVAASDRLRPQGRGFGVAITHLYPSTLFGQALEAIEALAAAAPRALGLRDAVAYPQLLSTGAGAALVVEVAARILAGQMVEVALYGAGIDLVEVVLRQSLGEAVPDGLVRPRFTQPLAVYFLTAKPGALPTGRVSRVRGLERVLAAPGVVQADVYLVEGEVIRPVQRDGDRRGYVIAVADTNLEALDRAEKAARLLEVEVEEP
jgi:biotin carboxylase